MTDLDNYRLETGEVRERYERVRRDVDSLVKLTKKASESPYGVSVQLVDANGKLTGQSVTVGKSEGNQFLVNSFKTPILNEINDLYNYYRAAKAKPKTTRKNARADAFQTAKVVQDPAYNFFTSTANLGRMDPALVGGVKIDATGNMLPGQLVDNSPSNALVSQFLQGTLYNQRIASQLIISTLCYIYMYQNNHRGLAARNRGKPYVQWETTYQGATDEFYSAFLGSFQRAEQLAGKPKPDGKGVYQMVSKAEFTNKFYGRIAADNVVKDESQLPSPSKPLLSAYTVLSKAEKERIEKKQKKVESDAKKVGADPLTAARAGVNAWEDINFGGLAQQAVNSVAAAGITASQEDAQALGTYAAVDELNYKISLINDRNAANYAELDRERDKYRAAVKKAEKANK